MKGSGRIIIYLILLHFDLSGQNTKEIPPVKNKGLSLEEAFKKLESEKKIHLAFNPDLCSRFISGTWDNKHPLDLILEEIIRELPFQVKKQDESHYLVFFDTEKLSKLEKNRVAKTKINFSGTVDDISSKESIVGALIILMPDGFSTQTDHLGHFQVQYVSKHDNPWIEIKYLGYQKQIIPDPSNIKERIHVSLFPELSLLPPVTVQSSRPNLNIERIGSNIRIDPEMSAYRMQANAFKDPMRMLQQTAGINATDDRSSGLQIRGSNSDENLIKLNGLTLFNVDHFYGVFSSINPYIVSNIDIYKSYFPSNFGGRTSSVILIKSPESLEKWKGGVDLNLITANAYLQAPISNKINLVAGVRTTTFDLGNSKAFHSILQSNNSSIDPLQLTDSTELLAINPEYKFHDNFFKLDIKPFKKLVLSASSFNSSDQLSSKYQSNSFNSGYTQGIYNESSSWSNQAANLAAKYNWTEKMETKINLARSQFNFNQQVLSIIKSRNVTTNDLSIVSNQFMNINFTIAHQWQIDKHMLSFGYEYNFNQSDAKNDFNKMRLVKDSAHNKEMAGFVQADLRFLKKIIISPGLRISHYEVNKNSDFSPRLSMTYQWNNQHATIFNLGKYYQYMRQSRYEDRFGREYYLWVQNDNKKYPSLLSRQYELKHLVRLNQVSLKTEVYYKSIEGLVENLLVVLLPINPGEPFRFRSENLVGKGRTYGLDLSYEHQLGKYIYYVIYSYNKSENSFPTVDNGAYYPKAYARTHQIKTNHQYTFRRLDVSMNAVYGSALPYNDVFLSGSSPKDRRPKQLTKYLDDYFRVDIDLRYTIPIAKTRLELGFSVLNLLDRVNTKYAQSLFTFQEQSAPNTRSQKYVVGAEVQTLRRTLNLNIGFHF